MDAPFHVAGDPTAVIPPEQSSIAAEDRPLSTLRRKIMKKKKKKRQSVVSDSASLNSSSNCSSAASHSQKGIKISRNPKKIRAGAGRRNVGLSDVDALGLPLGMSIAAVVAQVLERKCPAGTNMSVDYLSGICGLAVRESLGNVFGDKFDNLATNFETSFRSTLMTLKLINGSSQIDGEQLQRERFGGCSCSMVSDMTSQNKDSTRPPEATDRESCTFTNIIEQQQRAGYQDIASEARSLSSRFRIGDSACLSSNRDGPVPFSDRKCDTLMEMEENVNMNSTNKQLVLHDKRVEQQQLACASPNNHFSMLSTIEKSVMEQTRSNDLKTFEIGLIMKKMHLKERELELHSNSNILERWKLSMGISKASFKAEKFKTQVQDSRQVELLKKCLDLLVGGLIIMLFSLAYGTYVYSYQRIVEDTNACSPYTNSKSWWMPNAMSSFNAGLQLLQCQIQVFSRMLFGFLVIGAIAAVLIKRSASCDQTMPITFTLLLLGVGCGVSGKICIDSLGGSGWHWLMYWEALCLLHFFSNIFHSTLYIILNGPIIVAETVHHEPVFPYWMRKSIFYGMLLFLPLLCGLMPFASSWEWVKHFSSQAANFLT